MNDNAFIDLELIANHISAEQAKKIKSVNLSTQGVCPKCEDIMGKSKGVDDIECWVCFKCRTATPYLTIKDNNDI